MAVGTEPQLQVAIVGGGIIGLITAMGLLKRNISVKMYEQSRLFREIGAGVAFTANAMQCMELIDPAIVEAVNAVATPNGEDSENPNDYLRFHDGYNCDPSDPERTDDQLKALLHTGYRGFQGCHRAHLLDELVRHIPEHAVEFGKRFVGYEDRGSGEKLLIHFQDGTTAEADAVIGCDGIKSKVRQVILGPDHPASLPHFSHKVAYRALVPMDRAEPVLGTFKARNQHMHTGPSAHILHFPVVNQTILNIVAFVTEPSDWPVGDSNGVRNMTAEATREELEAVFQGWGPTVRNIVGLLPDKMDKWGIFDMYDHPAPTYVRGRVCVAGDAAHASSPHHGAGAGIGVEDALALCTLFDMITASLPQTLATSNTQQAKSLSSLVEAAFQVFDQVRPPRSQWLVKSSREACDIYEWNYPETKRDWDKCLEEITTRSHKLWYFDIDGMLKELQDGYHAKTATALAAN
ncbi:putative FAD-binding domain-containing protein [Seiridium unicorne]|uniref:FAD-binding domain-containing protein n=1 Tax=Seiridium unicorne TaxID=138068 RepID=A0ABR2VAY3_9PEZI